MDATVAIVSRDATIRRFEPMAAALRAEGLEPAFCAYDEARAEDVERELSDCAAALVWVNPVQDGRTRRPLDALLRRVAARGVLVSTHPDVIDKLGVKAVLPRTRALGWDGDARRYASEADLREGLPRALEGGPRVLKHNRGSSGEGVWKLERLAGGQVRVTAASGDRVPAETGLDEFLALRLAEFAVADGYVDQAFQPRLSDGMIRCYMSAGRLAGFGWQKVTALLEPRPAPPRTYSGPDDARFQSVRERMEGEWTPGLRRILELGEDDLPALWDADLLFGPRDADGRDSFVLCEINVSSVHPMPDEAPAAVARTVAERLSRRRQA